MRIHYTEKLQEIRSQVVGMGTAANEMVRKASESVMTADSGLANDVIRDDDFVDNVERQMTIEVVTLVMQENPVAGDLRFLVSTLGVIGEIETVADDAVKLARRSLKLGGFFPGNLKMALSNLSDQARLQFASALKLYTEYSPELAQSIIDADEVIDNAYSHARDSVLDFFREDPSHYLHMVRTIEVFHALEHVADHAVAISKRMQLLHVPPPSFQQSIVEELSHSDHEA
jgi:phosphate transport system protein